MPPPNILPLYPAPPPCAMLWSVPAGFFFPIKWCPWKFSTCILLFLMFFCQHKVNHSNRLPTGKAVTDSLP